MFVVACRKVPPKMMSKGQSASFNSFQISSMAEESTTLDEDDESLEVYEDAAGSGDDGEKV